MIFNLLMFENVILNFVKFGKMFQLEIKIELKYLEISNKICEILIDIILYSKGLLKSCFFFLIGFIMKILCKVCF